jgi:diguanylate cyclase (GGDEF)-like protein
MGLRDLLEKRNGADLEPEPWTAGGFILEKVLSLDIVSALAGDRQLTDPEKAFVDEFRRDHTMTFYSELLYTITHQYFPPHDAEGLWKQILQHKFDMSAVLHRNVRIAVASLDYLSNLKSELSSPTVIDETFVAEIVRRSIRDGLTSLFNHSTCFQKIKTELSRYQRYNTVFSIMMIDIDNFKKINDRYGHQEGDKILAMLGTMMEEETRDSDICCRYGGEEFTIILPSTGLGETCLLAERLRSRVERSMPVGRRVTLSIGVASCHKQTATAQSIIDEADSALYRAKRSWKNRVIAIAENGEFIDVQKEKTA